MEHLQGEGHTGEVIFHNENRTIGLSDDRRAKQVWREGNITALRREVKRWRRRENLEEDWDSISPKVKRIKTLEWLDGGREWRGNQR